MNYINNIKRTLFNLPGWHTNRKIVVIESDDWGSIRMPNKNVYVKLKDSGIKVDNCIYCKNDSLENYSDFTELFNVLSKYRDSQGNFPVFTVNTIMANPNFKAIKLTNFTEYHYELFSDSYKRLGIENMDLIWKEGIENKLLFPQLHGREHLHVNRWLEYLQKGSEETLLAFENEMFGLSKSIVSERRSSFMAAFDAENEVDLKFQKNAIFEATEIFKKYFGFASKSFIATNYIWSQHTEKALKECKVKYLQGGRFQIIASIDKTKANKKFHFTGEKNELGQLYTVRNCLFEPSSNTSFDWVNSCLNDINLSFTLKKPAIITSHRVNFIGSINSINRDNNLKKLDQLLRVIVNKWPNVEFMNSVQLGDLINNQ
jgi:hypothetical protein